MQTRNSHIELLDPRVKLFGLIVLSVQLLMVPSTLAIIGAAVVVVAAIVVSPVGFRSLFRNMVRVAWFVAFVTVLNTFTLSGEVFVEVFGFYGTVEGLRQGLMLSARLVLLLSCSFLFTQTTRTAEMMDAVESILSPFRRLCGPTVVLLGLTVNFVPMLVQSAQQIKRAQLARGADADANFFRQIRFALSAALPLFVSALRTSHHLAEAMEARGYDPRIERTDFSVLRMKTMDWVAVLIVVGEILFVLLL